MARADLRLSARGRRQGFVLVASAGFGRPRDGASGRGECAGEGGRERGRCEGQGSGGSYRELAAEVAEGGEGEMMLRGGLFTHEFLLEGIKESEAWKALDDSQLVSIRAEVEKRLAAVQKLKKASEAETESELIWPTLRELGWKNSLPQQNLSFGGREKVPDGLLFGDSDAKDRAAAEKGASRFEDREWGDTETGAPSETTEAAAPAAVRVAAPWRAAGLGRMQA